MYIGALGKRGVVSRDTVGFWYCEYRIVSLQIIEIIVFSHTLGMLEACEKPPVYIVLEGFVP